MTCVLNTKNVFIEKFSQIGYIILQTENEFITGVSFANNISNIKRKKYILNNTAKIFFEKLEQYFNNVLTEFDLPYKVNCSEFSKKVYNVLKEIPYGKVVTYESVARKLGSPKAARAVGNACARNPLPIIIPCHRVVRKNGSLGGFTGGIHIKKFLLDIEN